MYLLTRLSIAQRWLTLLIAAAVIGLSIFLTTRMQVELIPDIEFPMVSIVSLYPGAPAEQVEEITARVEAAIAGVEKPDEMSSTSSQNMSVIIAMYDFGTDMDSVNAKISSALESLDLPAGAQPPQVYPINLDILPVVSLSLSGDLPPSELREIAISQLVPRLEEIDGVFNVGVEGGEEGVIVSLDVAKLNEAGISAGQIAGLLRMSQPEYASLDEIKNLPLAMGPQGQPMTAPSIADVADVQLGLKPGTALARTNGATSVSIIVSKEADANTVDVANAVVEEAARVEGGLGTGVHITTVLDQSEFIEGSINDLVREAIIGGILAVVVIFIFLLAIQPSLVTAISIPASILLGFLTMYFWGITINILTLSAMAIAVGRVVDDSIVMLEVIFRRMRQGESFREAALNGSREVAMPITSATIATVAIFIPLAFVGGIVGEMFRPFAFTLTFALLGSLLVALMVIPPLCWFIGGRKSASDDGAEPDEKVSWYHKIYIPSLRWALTHRTATVLAALVLTVGSLALVPFIGTSFMHSGGEAQLNVEIEMPRGTSTEVTAAKASEVDKIIGQDMDTRVFQTTVGQSSSLMGAFSAMAGGAGDHIATITVMLESGANVEEEAIHLRELLAPVAGEAKITVADAAEEEAGMSGMDSSSMRITVTGDDPDTITQAANKIQTQIEAVAGISGIESDAAEVLPQPQINLNPTSMAALGMDPQLVQQELSMLLMGAPVSRASVNGQDYDVLLAPVLPTITNPAQLLNLKVGFQQTASLGEIANVSFASKPIYIRRVDQARAITVSGTITAKDVGAVNQEVQQVLDSTSLPSGVRAELGGVAEQMAESFRQIGIAIIIAIGISYLVMVVTLRSLLNPFIIMFSLPLASVGALLGLLLTGRSLGVSGMMGSLMLVGIVLTNAIVLITLVEQLRRSGMSTFDALMEGGRLRIRPILMTALTTMIALVPLAIGFGEGVLLAAELATVVIGGLFTSTILTLVVVPVIYSLFDSLRQRISRGRA